MTDQQRQSIRELFPFFASAGWQDHWSELQLVDVPAGDALFGEGQAASGLYLVVSGRFSVQRKTGFADKKQVVALLAPGSFIGESALAGESVRGTTVVAVEKSSAALLPLSGFIRLTERNPGLAIELLQTLLRLSSLRLRKCSERLALVL